MVLNDPNWSDATTKSDSLQANCCGKLYRGIDLRFHFKLHLFQATEMTEAHSFARSLYKWTNSQLSPTCSRLFQPELIALSMLKQYDEQRPTGDWSKNYLRFASSSVAARKIKISHFYFFFLLTSQLQLDGLNFTFQVSHPLTQRLSLGSLPDGCTWWIHPRIRETFHLALHALRNVHFELHTCRLDMFHVPPQWCCVHLFFVSKRKAIETRASMKQICSNRTSSSFALRPITIRGWGRDVLQFLPSGN